MLYLLKSPFIESDGSCGTILKVGYAKNFSNRLNGYRNSNPSIKEEATKEGELIDEYILHIYLADLGYRKYAREWYQDCQEVYEKFKEPLEISRKYVWDNRRKLIHKNMKDNKIIFKYVQEHVCPDFLEQDYMKLDSYDKYYFNYLESESLKSIYKFSDFSNSSSIKFIIELMNRSDYYETKFRELCKFFINNPSELQNPDLIKLIQKKYLCYINLLGINRVYSLGCQEIALIRELKNLENSKTLDPIIYSSFQEGQKYMFNDIKGTLQQIYSDNGISKKAKANDLEEWFETKNVMTTNKQTGKRDAGYLLLKKLK